LAGTSAGSCEHRTFAHTPSVGRFVQMDGLPNVQLKPISPVHVGVHPSPDTTLPSSQVSLPSRFPSPQVSGRESSVSPNVPTLSALFARLASTTT
jgi:hypothetical protein